MDFGEFGTFSSFIHLIHQNFIKNEKFQEFIGKFQEFTGKFQLDGQPIKILTPLVSFLHYLSQSDIFEFS